MYMSVMHILTLKVLIKYLKKYTWENRVRKHKITSSRKDTRSTRNQDWDDM
jgi:hypothetical protein